MNEYDFALHFKLTDSQKDPSEYEDLLFEAGCDDALIGIGMMGHLGCYFIRTSKGVVEAIYSAIDRVKTVIPESELYYISPDVVSIRDLARIMNCSRQNVLKLKNNHMDTFPQPINTDGKSLNWHLAEVLRWYQLKNVDIDESLLEVAEFAMQFNLEKQSSNLCLNDKLKEKARALVT